MAEPITTDLTATATPGAPSTFAPKLTGPHDGVFTDLALSGTPGPTYSFAPKPPTSPPHEGIFTDLALSGTPGPTYAFTPKAPGRTYQWPRWNPNVPDIGPVPDARVTPFGQQSFTRYPDQEPNPIPSVVSLDVRKKVGQTVFQKTTVLKNFERDRTGPVLQRRRMVLPADPRTNAQLLRRARFGVGVQQWHALTPEAQAEYKRRGLRRAHPAHGINLYLAEFIRDHPAEDFQAEATYLLTHDGIPPAP